nr:hypothetical protein [Janthinobacterium lividum]
MPGDQLAMQGAQHGIGAAVVQFQAQFGGDGVQDFVRLQAGLSKYSTSTWGGRRSASIRHSMVLPLPTSPVSLMMPSPCVTAYSSASSSSPRVLPV